MTAASPRQQGTQRDPNMAGGMSLILPGLGQLYNGEQRKGLLFMLVGVINYLVLIGLIFAAPLMASLKGFGDANQMKLNGALADSLAQLQIGSGASFMLIGLFLSFAVFAARDAFDKASHLQRKSLYHDYFLEMPEATSGSYIFHISIFLTCFLLAFFFLIPPPPRSQITDIEFIQNEENTKTPPKTQKRAAHNSQAGGKHDPNKPSVQPSPAPKAPSKAQEHSGTPKITK